MNTTLQARLDSKTGKRILSAEGDAETSAAGGPLTEPKENERTKIANRNWIDDAGKEVAEEDATGVSYEFLGRTKDGVTIPPDGVSFKIYGRDMSERQKELLAFFGAVTLMGNVTNTWMGDKSLEREPRAADAIAARFALLHEGKWIDRTREGGARVNLDALAKAVVTVFAQKGKALDEAVIRSKLESDADFLKACRNNPDATREYAALMGRATTSVDDLAKLIG